MTNDDPVLHHFLTQQPLIAKLIPVAVTYATANGHAFLDEFHLFSALLDTLPGAINQKGPTRSFAGQYKAALAKLVRIEQQIPDIQGVSPSMHKLLYGVVADCIVLGTYTIQPRHVLLYGLSRPGIVTYSVIERMGYSPRELIESALPLFPDADFDKEKTYFQGIHDLLLTVRPASSDGSEHLPKDFKAKREA
ncbi:MAG TPA: hypothetical protein VFE47_11605 [Tepidisphaeraceae bacterium]|nr:hypothetical protein [Tepidisphaeraceae bacterium]